MGWVFVAAGVGFGFLGFGLLGAAFFPGWPTEAIIGASLLVGLVSGACGALVGMACDGS